MHDAHQAHCFAPRLGTGQHLRRVRMGSSQEEKGVKEAACEFPMATPDTLKPSAKSYEEGEILLRPPAPRDT
jgi:hypothetical protein